MTNLTHNSFLCIYFNSLHVSSNPVLITRRINCINTTSDIWHSVSVTVSCAGRKGRTVPFRPAYRHSASYIRGCIDTIDSPGDEHGVAQKILENWNKYIENNCASCWSFTKNHNEMYGQQNVKKHQCSAIWQRIWNTDTIWQIKE